ncbi:MAG: hypothetical protein ACON5B_06830 [Myxococcota bacterium]
MGSAIALAGCGEAPLASGQVAGPLLAPVYAPRDDAWFSMPWPNDLRRGTDGHPDLSGFPNSDQGIVGVYRTLYEDTLDGFSTMPVMVVPFRALPIDVPLPAPEETRAVGAPVRLVGVSSAVCGEQVPIEVVRREAMGDPFLPETSLLASPVHGFRLPESTTWALVDSRGFGADGTWVGTGRPTAFDMEAPVHEELRRCFDVHGWDTREIAVASVFTTQSVTRDLEALREDAWTVAPSPAVSDLSELKAASGETWTTWKGTLDVPIYQEGESPYVTGGDLVFEGERPVIQRMEPVPFVVTWDPDWEGARSVVVWQSGARASLWGFTDEPLAEELRQTGAVVLKFLPQFHGARNPEGGDADLHTYNYLNPASGRTVLLQEAVDVSTFVRFVNEAWAEMLPEVETEHVALVGHSQGAEVGAMLVGVEPRITAYVLHGVGTYVADTLVHRTDPFDVPELLGSLLGLTGAVDRFHPILGLVQMGAERVDPGNYTRLWARQDGAHVLVVNGYADDDVYFRSMDALTIGAGLTPVAPMGWDPDPWGVWGGEPVPPPLAGNVLASDGRALTQATLMVGDGDHYTVYEDPSVRSVAVDFLEDALGGRVPEVRAFRSDAALGSSSR